MSHAEFDESSWPILRITPPPTASHEELEWQMEQQHRVLARETPHVIIFDMRQAEALDAHCRARIALYERTNHELIRANVRGTAFVVTSPFIRAIVKSVLWLTAPAYPTLVAETIEDAVRWAKGMMTERGKLSGRPSPAAARPVL